MNSHLLPQAMHLASISTDLSIQTVIICGTVLLALVVIYAIVRSVARQKSPSQIGGSYAVVDRVKDLGDMVALSAFYKEITTDGCGGIPLLLTEKRVALISEFELEWRYDLRRISTATENGITVITLPPPKPKVNTGEITLHSTESGKLMGVIPVNMFSKEDWNKMVKSAREKATVSAKEQMRSGLLSRIEKSAHQSLEFLFESAGVPGIQIKFEPALDIEKTLDASVEKAMLNQKVA